MSKILSSMQKHLQLQPPVRRQNSSPPALPSKTLLAGHGSSKRNLLRNLSEKSLVRKISQNIKAEEEEMDEFESDLESTFSNSNSSFGFSVEDLNSSSHDGSDSDDEDDDDGVDLSGVLHIQATKETSSSSPSSSENWQWSLNKGESAPKPIAVLHRKELELGFVLGLGAFSQVFQVNKIDLKESDLTQAMTPLQQDARHKAVQDAQARTLVVKHLTRRLLRRPKEFKAAAMDLEREAKILSLAQHPNIVRLRAVAIGGVAAFDSGRFDDYFLVFDRMADTLDKRIQQWRSSEAKRTPPPDTPTMISYAQQLASALAYLHDHRLVFRDVKPQNIGFLTNTNTSKDRLQLFDFGLARTLPKSSSSSLPETSPHDEAFHMSLAGTTRYLAPEALLGQPYNCRVDVYSWALTVWEMMEQSKPYETVPARHFHECICHLHIRPGTTLERWNNAPAFGSIVNQAWASSWQDRPTMASVYHDLEVILVAGFDTICSSEDCILLESSSPPEEDAAADRK